MSDLETLILPTDVQYILDELQLVNIEHPQTLPLVADVLLECGRRMMIYGIVQNKVVNVETINGEEEYAYILLDMKHGNQDEMLPYTTDPF